MLTPIHVLCDCYTKIFRGLNVLCRYGNLMCIGRKVCLLLNVASVRLPNNVRRHLYLFTSFNVTFSADDVVPPQAQNLRTRHILFPFVCSELGNKTTIVYLSHAYIIFFHVLTWVILFLCNSQTITTRCCE